MPGVSAASKWVDTPPPYRFRTEPIIIDGLHTKKLVAKQMELVQMESEIAKMTVEAVSPEQIDTISNYLNDWENVSFEDKQQVLDLMITVIRATSEKTQIEWKSDGGHTVRPLYFMPLSSVVPFTGRQSREVSWKTKVLPFFRCSERSDFFSDATQRGLASYYEIVSHDVLRLPRTLCIPPAVLVSIVMERSAVCGRCRVRKGNTGSRREQESSRRTQGIMDHRCGYSCVDYIPFKYETEVSRLTSRKLEKYGAYKEGLLSREVFVREKNKDFPNIF